MNRRYFWLIPEFVKFRVVFETDVTVYGINDLGERRFFRKDTRRLSFDENEAFRHSVAVASDIDTEEFFIDRTRAVYV